MSSFAAIAFLLSSVALGQEEANYDESKVPDYVLPELLRFEDGKTVRNEAQWTKRRQELLNLFADYVYGRTPEAAEKVKLKIDVTQAVTDFLGGKASMKEVSLSFPDREDGPTLHLLVIAPKEAMGKPVPAFLGLNFKGNQSIHPDPRITLSKSWMRPDKEGRVVDHQATEASRGAASARWPVEMIIDRGYALATMYYGDIDPDFDDGFENGVHAVFGKPKEGEWGSIGTWAWGLEKALDYLELDAQIDGTKVMVFGHSRLGKTALWAGAQDERFAMVISNDSGCGGAALSRRQFGETVKRINTSFPHWFNDRFPEYNDRVGDLPIDQHELLALMAPRPLCVASAEGDEWADPHGEFLSAKFASPAWELFGKKGVGVDEMPPVDQPVGETISYHMRTGKHDVTDFDWTRYLDFADRHVK
ncbi:MAG: acetylxylan esterase [Verrucomicrobiae bacterium]|nr:acetylxylan esterase [Verrucomicrobiae bacterium]